VLLNLEHLVTQGTLILFGLLALLINAAIFYGLMRAAVAHALRDSLQMLAGTVVSEDPESYPRRQSAKMQADLAKVIANVRS
jgi:hypothetical protein